MHAETVIKNRTDLATGNMRRQALDIIETGISRVLPTAIIQSSLSYDSESRILTVQGQRFDLSRGRLFVVGGGKASGLMAQSLEHIVGGNAITSGIVTTKYGGAGYGAGRIEVASAGHPIPDAAGVAAVQSMLALKPEYSIDGNDTVVCLISGGGSALMPCPVDAITLEDKQQITSLLLASGADINEINTVRKHLSCVKGGRLGRYFAPATVISLILSDVIGNDLSVIASGPTYPDRSTFGSALGSLQKYGLRTRIPASVIDYLERGSGGQVEETPKALSNCYNFIIGDSSVALRAMKDKAAELGLKPVIASTQQKGDTAAAAMAAASSITGWKDRGYDTVLIGGETTPRLPANAGKGGRNQHYAAVSMMAMKEYGGHWVVASVGTDGSDFLPDVAGAIVDDSSFPRLESKGVDVSSYLERFDSYNLLERLGDSLVVTGNTGTNVGDVMVYVLG